ncbi:hypothetical protein MKEN_01310200 [Mycena kentingensis (nom. inval.)]|nr:hypothetical protein MKEN_01310200 [Mycena kentingensis (nom. inval.)]
MDKPRMRSSERGRKAPSRGRVSLGRGSAPPASALFPPTVGRESATVGGSLPSLGSTVTFLRGRGGGQAQAAGGGREYQAPARRRGSRGTPFAGRGGSTVSVQERDRSITPPAARRSLPPAASPTSVTPSVSDAVWRPSRGGHATPSSISQGTASSRGFSRQYAAPSPPPALPVDREILEGLEPTPIHSIPVPMLTPQENTADIVIRNLQSIGSYNWTNASSPTIIVPGSPREWCDRPLPFTVERDTGVVFKDQNSARAPDGQTFLPLFAAVDKMQEINARSGRGGTFSSTFDWASASVDFITDRNGLRKLLRWIAGRRQRNGGQVDEPMKDFRIDMQLAPGGQTILLNRWENRDREQMNGKTYGFHFEEKATLPPRGIPDSSGHHRIVSYDMSGLKMVVRFEVDAYVPDRAYQRQPAGPQVEVDDLAERLSSMAFRMRSPSLRSLLPPAPAASNPRAYMMYTSASSLTSTRATASPEPFVPVHGLTVIQAGTHIPHSTLVELTTRATRFAGTMYWEEAFPQLWLSQTPQHYTGLHNWGTFERVVKRAMGQGEFVQVEREVMGGMRKLRKALGLIAAVVRREGGEGTVDASV